ncbi:MAG TPA: hypothetical protein VK921_16630 [Anditalea sp.]|nr:hypothetical protein [Anditalea sp.]
MNQRLISLNERDKWNEALNNVPHAFGHTWGSCYSMGLTLGMDTYLYHFEDNGIHIVCPITERVYEGFVDVFTPYGFSGFVGNREYPGFTQIWKDFAEERNYVCGYIGMNPLLDNITILDNSDISSANDIYALNLKLSLDQLFSNLHTNRKRQVKKHNELLTTFSDDKSILKTFFFENFHSFFENRSAGLFSKFTKETLSNIVDLENVILIGKIQNEKIQAVSVFATTSYIAEYLFNISLPEGRSQTVPLLWEGIRILKEKGIPILNLGGGIKRGDSLSEFKERFGAEKYPIPVLKQVYNKGVFKELCERAGVSDTDNYFPPYRKKP